MANRPSSTHFTTSDGTNFIYPIKSTDSCQQILHGLRAALKLEGAPVTMKLYNSDDQLVPIGPNILPNDSKTRYKIVTCPLKEARADPKMDVSIADYVCQESQNLKAGMDLVISRVQVVQY